MSDRFCGASHIPPVHYCTAVCSAQASQQPTPAPVSNGTLLVAVGLLQNSADARVALGS